MHAQISLRTSRSATTSSPVRRGLLALALGLGLSLAGLSAQAAPPAPAAIPTVQGTTLEGAPFSLQGLRGKVTLLVYWSTDCAVCRDKMPELRANALGWRGQPFELVTISVDRKRKDMLDYERLVLTTVNKNQRLTALWSGDPDYQDSLGRPSHLPMTYLLNKQGQVVESYSGRIPPEAWDRIAELL